MLIRVVNKFCVVLCSYLVEVVWEFASMAKNQRQINHKVRPIDKDETLLSEVSNDQIKRDFFGKIEKILEFFFDFLKFSSFRLSDLIISPQKINLVILDDYLSNMLSTYSN